MLESAPPVKINWSSLLLMLTLGVMTLTEVVHAQRTYDAML